MDRLLQRFLRYVRIDTMADDASQRAPSSDGQWRLGSMLVDELRGLGLNDVVHTPQGIVLGNLPSNCNRPVATIALNAHLDTSPEVSGLGVQPQVVRNYAGGDLFLPGREGAVIRVSENPELDRLHGQTLITSDGTTLLGADDKAGVAVIMEVVNRLQQQPTWPHGRVRILFTCDEEIGRGVDFVDLDALDAQVGYTIDGPAAGRIDVETFSADLATITVHGINIHPSIAQGRLVNAIKATAAILERLPQGRMSPESTSGREGFLHPYWCEGGVAKAQLKILLRDFDTNVLSESARLLRQLATEVERDFPGTQIEVHIEAQYRNLASGLASEPRAVAYVEEAFRRLGLPCERSLIRGGTDGSQLTTRGLPMPNLSSGQHNPHSTLEWACLEEMQEAVEVVLTTLRVWAESC